MLIPLSLNGFVSWVDVLALLGVETPTAILPCFVQCPLNGCAGRLELNNDDNAGGTWAFCHKCRFAGDMIELAAAHWSGLSLPETIRKLVASGITIPEERLIPSILEQHITMHPEKRARFMSTWRQARTRLLTDDSKTLRGLQHKFGLYRHLEPDRWMNGPGLFLGGLDKQTIEACYQPLQAQWVRGSVMNGGVDRVFIGAHWSDCLVIPFSDMPGRIKGFMFIGREGRTPQDMVYRHAKYSSLGIKDRIRNIMRNRDNDAGLGLYEARWHVRPEFNNVLVVNNDPLFSVKVQTRNASDNSEPLPLVSIYRDEKARTSPAIWHTVRETLVFWGRPDGELFRHAALTNSKVSLHGFSHEGPAKWALKTPSKELLRKAIETARPWDELLEEILFELPLDRAEALLINMTLPFDKLERFVRECPEELRERLLPCMVNKGVKAVLFDDTAVIENSGWYDERKREQICNGILRIDNVTYHERAKKSYYTGRILIGEHVVPFTDEMDVVEKHTFAWMRERAIQAGAAVFVYNPKWEAAAISISTMFHAPKVAKCRGYIGWDDEKNAFVFPTFTIDSLGGVAQDSTAHLGSTQLPARLLTEPRNFTSDECKLLCRRGFTEPFWATAACIAMNVLSPALVTVPKGIALIGNAARAVGLPTAKALGCMEYQGTHQPEAMAMAAMEHGWPIVVNKPVYKADGWRDWVGDNGWNCVIGVNWLDGRVLALTGGWHMIEMDELSTFFDADCGAAATKVLPSFLQFLAKRRFKLPMMMKNKQVTEFTQRVVVLMARWFHEQGGDPRVIFRARRFLTADDTVGHEERATRAFFDLLSWFYDEGQLSLERDGFVKTNKPFSAMILIPGGRLFVPKPVLMRLLDATQTPTLSPFKVSKVLTATNVLLDESEYGGLPGWVIKEDEWLARLEVWREGRKQRLKVTSPAGRTGNSC